MTKNQYQSNKNKVIWSVTSILHMFKFGIMMVKDSICIQKFFIKVAEKFASPNLKSQSHVGTGGKARQS